MDSIQVLYTILNIRQKIQDQSLRVLYLKDTWGLEQSHIAKLEGCVQSTISRMLADSRKKNKTAEMEKAKFSIRWTLEELKGIQELPREILPDFPLVVFVEDILELEIDHPFYKMLRPTVIMRMASLSFLGVQNKHIQRIYNKTQPTVTMAIKRNMQSVRRAERDTRYNFVNYNMSFKRKYEFSSPSFFIANTQN